MELHIPIIENQFPALSSMHSIHLRTHSMEQQQQQQNVHCNGIMILLILYPSSFPTEYRLFRNEIIERKKRKIK